MVMARRPVILATYLVFGAYAVCAQATLLREVQVLVFGSELSWGLVLAFWLAGVAAGAAVGGRLTKRPRGAQGVLAAAAFAMPAMLVAAIAFLRLARGVLGVGPGEYVGPAETILVSLVSTVPVSLWVGAAFPAVSALLAGDDRTATDKARAVGWAYLTESAGALAGGVAFSFIVVGRVGAVPLALGGGALLAAAMGLVLHYADLRGWAVWAALGLAVVLAVQVTEGIAGRLDDATVRWRWETFASGLELVESRDTRYQNVALGRLGEQFSLYSNGIRDATWPDHADLAVEAHLAACEHPAPRRMLVLGGGAEGLLKELARHRPERLEYVTLDEQLLAVARAHFDAEDRRVLDWLQREGHVHFADARRFVKQAAARGEQYDLVVLAAPEPASALEARLYTAEFFAELAQAMADDGVLVFTLSTPVGYWSEEPAAYAGSIIGPLRGAFSEVILTFGSPMFCLAGGPKRFGEGRPPAAQADRAPQTVLADTGAELARRYRERQVASPYFDPRWFDNASDLLDPEKRTGTRRAIEAHPPAFVNTDERPAAALYHMRYWLQQSAAKHASRDAPAEHRADVLGALMRLRFEWAMLGVVVATALAAAWGIARGRAALRRTALAWSVGTTGFASMALEMALLYTFQTLYGYVYSMVGLVIGVFMFGLVVGSLLMNRRLGRAAADPSRQPGLGALVALDLALAVFAAGLVLGLGLLRQSLADWPIQVATFVLVGVSGVLGGLVFPLAAAVSLREPGTTTGRAAGAIDAADHAGACLGALAMGTLLVPILGVSGACLVVVAVKALSALVVGAAATMRGP